MDVKQFYDTIGGNYAKALETMMNDVFIQRMLIKFLDSTTYTDLLKAADGKDVQGIFNVTHMLKGVVGNLSLTPLQFKAATVCEMTRNVSDFSCELDKELKELLALYQFINSNLSMLRQFYRIKKDSLAESKCEIVSLFL